MKYLLDTHAFLWFVTDDDKLSSNARSIINNSNNKVYFSAASAWEMSIKVKLGRLTPGEDLEPFIIKQLEENNFSTLSITIFHSIYTSMLPEIHKDPFDRMLIAQSKLEDMPLISK
ncbi:MAG: type II toxin-antitoxin system VapC family toxin, partial [Desulfobacteraceae bacterium]|nr:type II toxin-antitoxin system VapC family toxin [Desulfobacteraceae bacterium]